MSLPVYPEHRKSTVEWVGSAPTHWTDTRLRFVARLNPSKSEVADRDRSEEVSFLPMDAVGDDGSLRLDRTRPLGDVEAGYTYFRDGDVAVAKITPCFENGKGAVMRGLIGGVGFGTTELIVARPLSKNSPAFLHWLFTSRAFRKLGEGAMYGAGGQKRVADDFVRDFRVALPPPEEQTAIAAFLGRETGKIDALVEAQRRLIKLLMEKRHAVITHAVTKGLDPAAPRKESGLEWLGEVPAHWPVMPIRKVARLESGHTPSRQKADYWVEEECVIPWFTLADVGVLRSGKVTRVSDTSQCISELGMANSAARLLPPETVLLSRTASVGFSGIMTQSMAVSQDFAAWVCGPELSPGYLLLCLRAMRLEFRRLMMGSTHQTIYMPDIEKLSIPLPPRSEQESIASFAFGQKALIDDLEDEAEKAINLLRERRDGLISAAVTGKIDVRQATAATTEVADQGTARRLVGAAVLELVADNPSSGRMTSAKRMYLAEAHVGVWELRGKPERKAAGPFDSALMHEVEAELARAGHIATSQPGGPNSQVRYSLTGSRGALRGELDAMLGDRRTVFDRMLADLAKLESKGVEAVATLYAVWNDMLIDGQTPTDDAVINGVLNDWHAEKRDKFTRPDLVNYLGWMRRHDLTPSGRGPRTKSGALL